MSLPRLTALAEILRERELARLSAANGRAGALHQQLEGLRASVRSRALGLARMAQAPAGSGGSAGTGGSGEACGGAPDGPDADISAGIDAGAAAGPDAGAGPDPDPGGRAGADPALSSGTEGRWLLWLARERQVLERRYLLQLAEVEDLRARSRRAFGRAEVLAKLADVQRKQARQMREKRAGPDPAAGR